MKNRTKKYDDKNKRVFRNVCPKITARNWPAFPLKSVSKTHKNNKKKNKQIKSENIVGVTRPLLRDAASSILHKSVLAPFGSWLVNTVFKFRNPLVGQFTRLKKIRSRCRRAKIRKSTLLSLSGPNLISA